MRVRKLTASDICEVTGYNRDQFRGLMAELPKWSTAPAERVARAYTAHDLIVLCVVHTLETKVGIRRKTIASFFRQLQAVLSGPKPAAASALLTIGFAPIRVDYLDAKVTAVEGVAVVVPLQPILDRVDQFLGAVQVPVSNSQVDLRLGPGLVRARRRRGSA